MHSATAVRTARITYLDGWRGLAIGLVLFGHFVPIPGSDAGRAGVELFFLLSGALMARLLIDRRTPIGHFLTRRVGRVLPTLLAFVAVATAAQLLIPATFGKFRLGDTVSVLFFYSNYKFLDHHPPILGHTWSLSIEEHSYLILAALCVGLARRRPQVATAAGALAVAMWIRGALLSADGLDYHQVYWRTDVRAASILTGFVLYLVCRPNSALVARMSAPWVQGLVFAMAAALLLPRAVPDPIKYTAGTALMGLGLVSLSGAPTALRAVLEQPRLVWLGRTSYSIYLVQQIFHVAKLEVTPVLWPAVGVAAIAAGALTYRFVERPGQRVVDAIVS